GAKSCWQCGDFGHLKKDCPNPPRCWSCGSAEHLKKECPTSPSCNERFRKEREARNKNNKNSQPRANSVGGGGKSS
ncbi:unnamed protein product, partial [Amoebophrya sp. A120]